jgi:hypothetical protein
MAIMGVLLGLKNCSLVLLTASEIVDNFQFKPDAVTPNVIKDILLNVKRLLVKGYIAPKNFVTSVTLLRVDSVSL